VLNTKNNKKYLNITIAGKTGSIEGKLWNLSEEDYSHIFEGDVVYIEGRIEKLKNNLQINIEALEKKDVDEKVYSDLIPSTDKNVETIIAEITNFKNSISSVEIKRLIDKIIFDEDFLPFFKLAPAASKLHHAYRGGLIEHSLSVTILCDKFSKLYRMVNRDILIAGAILHDIGKAYEYDNKTFNKTDEGKLIGHISMGLSLVDKKAAKIKNFPEKKLFAIKHLILSHHGELEWGSPVQPATIEAVLLHFADNIDSKVESFNDINNGDNGWFYNYSLRRNVLVDDYSEAEIYDKKDNKLKEKITLKTLF
jgi:3'-5' exoribonuclease